MESEIVRAAVGLPVAALWPLGVPALAGSVWSRAGASAVTAAAVLTPTFPDARAFALVVAVAVAAAFVPVATAQRVQGKPSAEAVWFVVGAAGIALGAALLLGAGTTVEAVFDALENDDVIFVLVGSLAAVFAAGTVIAASLGPLAERVRDSVADERGGEGTPVAAESEAAAGILNAGLYIGWLERALVFGLIVGGEPGAAALALTAKSLARFPTFAPGREPLAEYVLVGTLLSFTLALALAMGTRALLGEPVL
jgi:small-conductance mechanosensitive channel